MDFDVKKIAKSARLKISEDEEATIEKNIRDIIEMIERLDKIEFDDLDNKEFDNKESLESILLTDLPEMTYREDIQNKSISNNKLLDNAPKSLAGCIVVPKIVE